MPQKVNWTDGIDPKTGKPVEYDPNKDLQTYKIGKASRREQGKLLGCPNIQGGVNFFPTSYSSRTHMSTAAASRVARTSPPDPTNDDNGHVLVRWCLAER